MDHVHIDVKRIEFVVTNSCSGKCKHCSVAVSADSDGGVDAETAANVLRQLTDKYTVESVMTFGGEPLLYADTVCKIHSTARDCGVSARQIITNGFFSRDERKIEDIATALCASGVNDIMLSVDAFHQEYIPIEPVIHFAEALLKHGVARLRVHPAFLVDDRHQNSYNDETRRLLKLFREKGIESSTGNNIFPAGNAIKYFSDYFTHPKNVDLSVPCGQMPYTGKLDEIECVSVRPNGDLILCSFPIGNIYKDDVLTILNNYNPYENRITRALMEGGAEKLLSVANELGVTVDTDDCYSSCMVCRKVMAVLKERRFV